MHLNVNLAADTKTPGALLVYFPLGQSGEPLAARVTFAPGVSTETQARTTGGREAADMGEKEQQIVIDDAIREKDGGHIDYWRLK